MEGDGQVLLDAGGFEGGPVHEEVHTRRVAEVVNDVDQLHAEYRRSGAIVRQPPTNFSWACEMQVADPDGNVLRIGSDPKSNQPFGPWLDMEGRLWEMNAEGNWALRKA